MQIDLDHIKTFHRFLYSIEGIREIPDNNTEKKHFSMIGNMKVDLDHIKKNWELENAKLSDGKSIKPIVDNEALNNSFTSGTLNLRIISSIICYFFYHFLDRYYFEKKDISLLQELEIFFEYINPSFGSKPPILEIQALINYILSSHKQFIPKLKAILNDDDQRRSVQEKYDYLLSITANINLGFELDFIISNQDGEPVQLFPSKSIDKEEIPFEETILSSSKLQAKEEIEDPYFIRIKQRFSLIKLNVVGFELPIEHFIKKPLLKRDLNLKADLEKLEKQRLELLSFNQKKYAEKNKENSNDLAERINKIKAILNKEHDIIDIIGIGKDIFIEAPAGGGKSTMLRWLTYKFASGHLRFLPVFVELMYNSDNLKTLIEESCGVDRFSQAQTRNDSVVLFLDGFDQFTGNKVKLFKDIKSLKNQLKLQIIFSGRTAPNVSKFNVDLVIYNLSSFNSEDIENICIAYLGERNGSYYNDYIVSRNLKRYIDRPLYLCFLLAHIKRRIGLKMPAESIIKTLNVSNKGRLLHDVVVDYFLGDYEHPSAINIDNSKWRILKQQQLDLIKFLAYHMTIDLNDSEVITWKDASRLITSCQLDTPELSKIEADTVLTEFLKHNILHLKNEKFTFDKNEKLTFDKKELRLFFTALSLKEKITTYKQWKSLKKEINKKASDKYTWNSIQEYLIGLMDPIPFFSSFKKINFDTPILLDKLFLEQFKLSREFIDQKNFPENHPFINESYVVDTIKLILEKFYSVKKNTKGSLTIFSLIPLLRLIVKKIRIPNRYISKSTEDKFNQQFFQFIYKLHYGGDMEDLLSSFIKFDLKVTFEELLGTLSVVENEDYGFKRHIYDSVLRQEYVSIRLSPEEKAEIAFNYLFNNLGSGKYTELLNYQSSRSHLFTIDILQNYSSYFFNTFFKYLEYISSYQLKRFIVKATKRGNGYWFKFIGTNLKSENADVLFEFIKDHFLKKEKYLRPLQYALENSTDTYFIGLFQDYFKKVISDKAIPKKQRLEAFKYFFKTKRPNDINFLLESFTSKNETIINITIECFDNYFPQEYRLQDQIYNENLINFYCEVLETEHCTDEVKNQIISHIKYNSPRLDKIVFELFQSSDDYKLTTTIVDYMGDFKIKKAVPLLENLLKSNIGLKTLYNLFKIDCHLYKKHRPLFDADYTDVCVFLKNFTPESKLSISEIITLFKALHIGDEISLESFDYMVKELDTKKSKLFKNLSIEDSYLIKGLRNSLHKKCQLLEACN